jgi:AraC-like DNA-binding protein
MECLQLVVPPIPQFLTVGHSHWSPGGSHFSRKFQVYDMLFVKKGSLYITENGQPYEISPQKMLILEAGKTHWGHRVCEEETEIYWVHFIHPHPCSYIDSKDIRWSTILQKDTYEDTVPSKQFIFLPKFSQINMSTLLPVLDDMVSIHNNFNLYGALRIHALLTELFTLLQSELMTIKHSSRSFQISKKVEGFLQSNIQNPFSAKVIENEMQLNFDYLARCLKKHTGMSPLNYLQYRRIEEAKKLLFQTNLSIPEIAECVGMTDYNYFIRIFRRSEGLPPGSFRRTRQGLV